MWRRASNEILRGLADSRLCGIDENVTSRLIYVTLTGRDLRYINDLFLKGLRNLELQTTSDLRKKRTIAALTVEGWLAAATAHPYIRQLKS